MSQYAVSLPPTVTLPIVGQDEIYPVNQLFCVGRNYADHAIEMGHDPTREAPFFFMKPAWTVLPGGGDLDYPANTCDLHHEVELVVALKSGGQDLSLEAAIDAIFGFAIGIDFTRRDLQGEAKDKGRPWDAGKSFLHAAPCSAITPIEQTGPMEHGHIVLEVNGQVHQEGDLNQMIWKIPEIISRLSELFVLNPGDLVFTGTPAGVGPVLAGDQLEARIDQLTDLNITMCGQT